MPKRKTDQAILAEIREVIRDMETGFRVTNYSEKELGEGSTSMTEVLAVEIIRDLTRGTQNALTRDYKRTKKALRKAADHGFGS
jgi:hypothetical protein